MQLTRRIQFYEWSKVAYTFASDKISFVSKLFHLWGLCLPKVGDNIINIVMMYRNYFAKKSKTIVSENLIKNGSLFWNIDRAQYNDFMTKLLNNILPPQII